MGWGGLRARVESGKGCIGVRFTEVKAMREGGKCVLMSGAM